MDIPDEIFNYDLYKILDVPNTATSTEIRTAYKKAALKCHPDKNPDNPNAAKNFVLLSDAVNLLLDVSMRYVYDRNYIKKKEEKIHQKTLQVLQEMDEKLRKLDASPAEQKRKIELMKKKKDILNRKIVRERRKHIRKCQLHVSWQDNGNLWQIYTHDILMDLFSRYGNIISIELSSENATIDFDDDNSAVLADGKTVGHKDFPLRVTYTEEDECVQQPPDQSELRTITPRSCRLKARNRKRFEASMEKNLVQMKAVESEAKEEKEASEANKYRL